MTSNHSLYKHPKKFEEADQIKKLSSYLNVEKRMNALNCYRSGLNMQLLKEKIRHDMELLKIIKNKDEVLFESSLKQYEEKFGKSIRKRELKLILMRKSFSNYSTSQINGWIKKEIERLENKISGGKRGKKNL
jgi:hypothetical protein